MSDDQHKEHQESADEAERLRTELQRLEQDAAELRRQVSQTYAKAMRDPLTQLPNRRAYEERIDQEFARWRRFAEPLVLLVLGVDDFESINDTHGHDAGEKALLMAGRILADRLRETDFIARYADDEFVVVLAGADEENALRLADAMRVAVAQGDLRAHGAAVEITVSVGAAAFTDGDTPQQVFERAEQAWSTARRQGKNRVVAG
jgi:diguanylate cyclase